MFNGGQWANKFKWAFTTVIAGIIIILVPAFAVAAPRITGISPANLAQLDQGLDVQVRASVYSATGSIKLTVDGSVVTPSLDGTAMTYRQDFTPGLHKVYLLAVDAAGERAERYWEFYVNDSIKPTLLPNNSQCTACHAESAVFPDYMSFPGHLVDPTVTGKHPYHCGACHYYKTGEPRLIVRADGSDQLVGADGRLCSSCHAPHGSTSMYLPPKHDNTNWKGTWSPDNTTIKAPRENMDCQYCHQPGTKVRIGHDLVSDHEVVEPDCTTCHSAIMTVVHNTGAITCDTCHSSADPVVQNAAKGPSLAKAGSHASVTDPSKTVDTQYFNDLNLASITVSVYGPEAQVISDEWSPGSGLQVKRLVVDGWRASDQQYILAYVEKEDAWYRLSVADQGQAVYGRYPATSMARIIYLPPGTTKIKTEVISGFDNLALSGLEVKEAYYNSPAKCTDCHASHESQHATTLPEASCASCHKDSLTQEHMNNPATQTVALSCATCHSSIDPTVQQAVYENNKACSACHLDLGHNEFHQVAYANSKCGVCHKDTLSQEHSNNPITQSQQLSCDTCHNSPEPSVQAAVYNNDKQCSACHIPEAAPGPDGMTNNLSNAGCVSCHVNYPVQHTTTNCIKCHISGPNTLAMWNCRYCHLTTYTDTYPLSLMGYPDWTGTVSGFKSWLDPLHGGALGSKSRWMSGHFSGGSASNLPPNSWPVDANFDFHTNGPHIKHTAALPAECAGCHQNTLTAAHAGKSKLISNPTEDFEYGTFAFNFTGLWGGDFILTNTTAYSGSYSFKNNLIGGSSRYGGVPTAVTETDVNVSTEGTVSFWYKVSGTGTQLSFYIDNTQMLAGTAANWTQVSYPLGAGAHKLKWSTTGNSVYIDDLTTAGTTTVNTVDCNTCHLSTNPLVTSAISSHNTGCLACHPSTNHDNVSHAATISTDCQNCHSADLVTEHQARKDVNGNAYTCQTCHLSSTPAVAAAIGNGVKDCSACHSGIDHEAVHIKSLGDACQTCHQGTLTQEHMNNIKTTAGKNYTCGTCHESLAAEVRRSIAAGVISCAGCHRSGHDIGLVTPLPADIPLYAGFSWSTPMEALLLIGEAGVPEGYGNGQLIISGRRADVTVNDIVSYYNSELGAQGWTQNPGAVVQDSYFSTEYAKNGRTATVKGFNTERRDGAGTPAASGFRIEIWFK